MSTKALVLKALTLHNFATFDNGQIHFDPGFNAIIGETGSGKSLILEALQLILGSRADKKLVRKDSEFSSIEASFSFVDDEIKTYFEEIGFPVENNEILIKRLIYKDGLSKSFLNYQSCSLATLTQVSKRFVDLVGQFENQKLLSETYQLSLLDHYAGLKKELSNYQSSYLEFGKTKNNIEQLLVQGSLREQRIDFLKFQKDEIEKLNPSEEDEKNLSQEKFSYQNKEQKQLCLGTILGLLSDNHDGKDALTFLKSARQIMDRNSKILNPQYLIDISDAILKIEELSFSCQKELEEESTEFDIDLIMEKLDLYNRIKKKFGPTIAHVKAQYQSMDEELNQLLHLEENLEDLHKKMDLLHTQSKKFALTLHQKREIAAAALSSELTQLVRNLKMKGSTLKIQTELLNELGNSGLTGLKFIAETNPGEGYFKIKDIASGGELSRILLALRQVLASKDSISVFLFDEIDTGMGGETALCIGKSLKEVSINSQVIAITHLPQIAVHADKLILVSKDTIKDQKRTVSRVSEVVGENRAKEISAMVPLN
ncbi:MAG: DNA repair protein RecN [Bacteriovoracaceae bacterium]